MTEDDDIEYEARNYPTIAQAVGLSLRFLLYSGIVGYAISKISFFPHSKNTDGLIMLLAYVISIGMVIWAGFNKFKEKEGLPLKLKFNRAPWIAIIVAACMIMTTPVLTDPISILIPMPDAWKKIFEAMDDNNIFSLIAIIVAAPILEEVFFRGVILNGLLKNYSPQTAIIVSASIFAAIHLNPWQAIPAFLGGLLMGWMYWKTNSIIPGMILHFANNLFSVLLGLAFKDADTLKQLVSTPVYIGLYLFCAAVLMGGWYFLEEYFERNPIENEEWEPDLASADEE